MANNHTAAGPAAADQRRGVPPARRHGRRRRRAGGGDDLHRLPRTAPPRSGGRAVGRRLGSGRQRGRGRRTPATPRRRGRRYGMGLRAGHDQRRAADARHHAGTVPLDLGATRGGTGDRRLRPGRRRPRRTTSGTPPPATPAGMLLQIYWPLRRVGDHCRRSAVWRHGVNLPNYSVTNLACDACPRRRRRDGAGRSYPDERGREPRRTSAWAPAARTPHHHDRRRDDDRGRRGSTSTAEGRRGGGSFASQP